MTELIHRINAFQKKNPNWIPEGKMPAVRLRYVSIAGWLSGSKCRDHCKHRCDAII